MSTFKIKTDKEFNEFIKYLKDDSKQEERKNIYAGLDSNLLIGKAQYIANQTSGYINEIMSRVLERASNGLFKGKTDDVTDIKADVDNKIIADIIKLQNVIAKLKVVLPENQQEAVLGKTMGSFESEDLDINAKDCLDAILSFKSGLSACTKKIFDIIVRDIEVKKYVDVDSFNRELEKPEILDVINGNKLVIKEEEEGSNNSIGLLMSVLNSQTKGLNTENLAKMYAYVNSGWAAVDLGDLNYVVEGSETFRCHKSSKYASKLHNILKDIKKHSDNFLRSNGISDLEELKNAPQQGDLFSPYELVEHRNQLLAEAWLGRLQELTVDVTLSNIKGGYTIRPSTIKLDNYTGSGQPDVVIQIYRSNNLLVVNATALEHLNFNNDSKTGSSLLRHTYSMKKLQNQYVSDLGEGLDNISNQANYGDNQYVFNIDKIDKVEVALVGLSCVQFAQDKAIIGLFTGDEKNKIVKPLSQNEMGLINTHHLVERCLDYSHKGFFEDTREKTDDETKMAILDIDNFITLGNKQSFFNKVKLSGSHDEKLKIFVNDFLVPYHKQVSDLITSRVLSNRKEFIKLTSNSEGSKKNIIPFAIKLGYKLLTDTDKWVTLLSLSSKMDLVDSIGKLIESIPKKALNYNGHFKDDAYPFFNDPNVRRDMIDLVRIHADLKESLSNQLKNIKKTEKTTNKLNSIMKKIMKAKIIPNIEADIEDVSIDVVNKVTKKSKKNI